MGVAGAIFATGVESWKSSRMADAADRRRDALSAARWPAPFLIIARMLPPGFPSAITVQRYFYHQVRN